MYYQDVELSFKDFIFDPEMHENDWDSECVSYCLSNYVSPSHLNIFTGQWLPRLRG